MSSSYHPQTDGQTERQMRVLTAGLRAYTDKRQRDWSDHLSMMEAFYNSSRHESTGKTPFEMDGVVWTDAMTLALRSPIMTGVTSQSAEDILTDVKVAWEDARKMLMSKQVRMKAEADRHRRDEKYVVGDKVLLSTRRLNRKASALSDPYVGPFTISRVSDNGVNVWLDLPKKYGRLHQPFHVEKVKRFTPSAIGWRRDQEDRPPPEEVDGEPEYEVEMLLGKRVMEEVVEVQPEDGVEGDDGEPSDATSDEEEAKEDVQRSQPPRPLRRSARLTGKKSAPAAAQKSKGRQTKTREVRQLVTRYLVKWKGYGMEEVTWEREANLRLHAQDSIDEYEYRQAEMRGEATVGVHCTHSLRTEADGSLSLQTVVVSGHR